MYYSGINSRTSSSVSKFTGHAAADYSKRFWPLVHHQMSNSNRSLLSKLNSDAYNNVEQLVRNTFPNCNIDKIRLVHSPQMYGMYMLRHEEMKLTASQSVQEKLLFHVTAKSRAMESLNSGLDWRRTRRKKFGCGVSFSDDADYANYHATKVTREGTRVIMICNVLVSETYVVKKMLYGKSLIVPPGHADTTMSHTSRVYVKYNDNDFYPLCFVYYQRRPEHMTESKYFNVNTHRHMNYCDHLEAIGYYDDDDTPKKICYDDENDDYNNELNGDDVYDYLEAKGYYDDTPEKICYDNENDDYSNELNGDYLYDYPEAKGFYDYDDNDTFKEICYHDENDEYRNESHINDVYDNLEANDYYGYDDD